MKTEEKIKKVYQKSGMTVSNEMIDYIINSPERLQGILKLYKQEKIESMNYIFGKSEDNKYFTEFELEAVSRIDLFDRKMVGICKIIWDNRDNIEQLECFANQLEKELRIRKEM